MFLIKSILLKSYLTNKSLRTNLNNFISRDIKTIKYIQIIVKIKSNDNKIFSLSNTMVLSLKDSIDSQKWKEQIISNLEQMNENYKSIAIIQLIFQYKVIDKNIYKNYLWKNPWNIKKEDNKLLTFPLSIDYDSYALTKIEKGTSTTYTDMFGFKDSKYAKMIVNNFTKNFFQVELAIKNKVYKFIDQLDESNKILTRKFIDGTILKKHKDMEWYFETLRENIKTLSTLKNEQVKELEKPLEYESPKLKIITLDIETWTDSNNTLHLMSAAIYSKSANLNNFYFINDYTSEFDMIRKIFETLIKFDNYSIFIHNGAKFDLIFLFKYLVELKNDLKLDFNIIYKDGELLQIDLTKDSKTISIKDSLKLLLSSLDNLAKVFEVPQAKTTFPHGFSNPNNFNYEGKLPDYKYYKIFNKTLLSKEEYDILAKSKIVWNFQNELKIYNLNDCIVLYDILEKLFDLILEKFNWNLTKNPTLSSLGFSIYRSSYIPEDLKVERTIKKGKKDFKIIDSKIQILDNKLDSFIRSSYFGGHVDSYIPHFDNSLPQWKDQVLTHYDVVSLYPSVMEKFDIPYAIKSYFRGDIRVNDLELYNNSLGFYKVNIMSPKEIINPIIPYRSDNGKVIYPTGYWGGFYFSEELKNAYKYGYRFEIIEGYLCDSINLFKNYINDLFELKTNSEKGTAMYLISKILMNSLGGKFGIRPDLYNYQLIENEKLKNLNKSTADEVLISDKYSLVAFENDFANLLLNVCVSSAIAAYSRSLMSVCKNDPNHLLFYSDTDSAFTNNPLSPELLGNNLGQFALENQFIKFISLGPKFYGGITTEGKEIVKVKGLNRESLPSYNELEKLLEKGKQLEKGNLKAFRNLSLGEIAYKDYSYLVQPSSNKRDFIYDNNRIVGTKSINIWSPYIN